MDDLTKEEYKGLIMMSNPNTAGTAKLIINTMIQMKGHDEAMEYFKLWTRTLPSTPSPVPVLPRWLALASV